MMTRIATALLFCCLSCNGLQLNDPISTNGLQHAAEMLKTSLNESVDPCSNFYEFACSGWLKHNPIPNDRSYYDRYTKLSETINKQIKSLYDDPSPSTSKAINKLKRFYSACMNTSLLNDVKTGELLRNLEKIGYWPIVHGQKFDSPHFDLTETLIKMAKVRALDVFFAAYGNVDLNNVSRLLIHFDRGSLGMSIPQFYLNPKRFGVQLSAYEHYMRNIAQLIARDAHSNQTYEQIDKDVKSIINFETQFAHLSLLNPAMGNFSVGLRASRLSDMDIFMPFVNWTHYFLSIMPEQMHDYIRSNPEIIIANPRFFTRLNQLLMETDPRVLMNVMLWRFADAWWLQLDDRFGTVRHDYMRRVVGIVEKPPRWKECAAVVNSAMPYATDSMYIRKFFKRNDFKLVQEMFTELRLEFIKSLWRSQWMDMKTKAYALEKAKAMQGLIGAPNFIYDDEALDKHYESLELDPEDTYATIVHKHSVWRQSTASLNLLKPVDLSLFPMSSTTVNAAYTFVRNALTIPGAILQPPFFDTDRPMSMNYGSIGSIISHEILHGFDMQGSQFDKRGNKRDWWGPSARERFVKRTACIIEQYSQYEVDGTNGMHIDGHSTQGENTADNGGIGNSYRAYQKYLAKSENEEPKIPGFEKYTNNQLFYISFAMSYCGHSKKEELVRQLFSDNHAPAQYRINGVMSNQPGFAQAFECPINSPMNPAKKCAVW